MRWVRTIVAFAVAAGLGVAAWRIPDGARSMGPVSRRALVPEGAIDPELVAEIVLEREGAAYRFERRDGSWVQVEPVFHPLDAWSVRQLVSRVLKAESIRTVEASAGIGLDLAAAGLSPPVGRITLREAGSDGTPGRTVEVELGRRSLAGRAYARRVGTDASPPRFEVIDAALGEFALDRDPREFRRRELFPELGEVRRVSLTTDGGRVVLARDPGGDRLEAPVRARADRAQAAEIVEALRRARSDGFIVDRPTDLAPYGLAPPAAVLEIDEAGARRKLLVGDVVSIGAQDRFGLVEGTQSVVRIPAEVLATAIPRPDRLVDAVAAGVRAQDVGAIEIEAPAGTLRLRRELEGWTAESRGEEGVVRGAVDAARVELLLAALTATRAAGIELGAYPAGDEIARITLRGFSDEPLDTVRCARRASDGRTILENGDGVLRLHGAIEMPLDRASLGFRPAPALQPAAGGASGAPKR